MKWILWIVVVVVIGFAAYVRLAPSDPARYHVDPNVAEDETGAGEAKRRVATAQVSLDTLHGVILATPRTAVLAGSVYEGHITYVTRSALWGFPDYTTVKRVEDHLQIWGRLRFGQSDMGVNAQRIDGWLAQVTSG